MEKELKIKYFLLLGVLLLSLFSFGKVAHAASLYFAPSSGDYAQGTNFTVSVLVGAEQSVNAVGGAFIFSTEYVEVLALSTANSFVNLWVQNPSFSNRGSTGNVRFEGIILNPGYVGSQGRIIDVVFRVKKTGAANLAFSEFTILANDGTGTNIASSAGTASFALVEPPPPEETEKRIEEIEPPRQAPLIVFQEPEPPGGILGFWEILPNWIKVSVILTISGATIIFLLIVVGLGIVVMIWLLGHGRDKATRIMRKLSVYLGMTGKEMAGDVAYSIHELEKEFQSVKQAPTLKELFVRYFSLIGRIVKRFFTINKNQGSHVYPGSQQEKIEE